MIVFTCITNGKDQIAPQPVDDNARYICFTDRPFRHPQWQSVQIMPQGINDGRRIARRYKLLSHIYFPNQPTIWIDGRVQLMLTPTEMMEKYKGDLVIRRHHVRDCIYAEAQEVRRINFEDKGVINRHIQWLRAEGFPDNYGLHETGCIIRRPTEAVERFNAAWWSALSVHSKRDQLSCDYIAWKLGVEIQDMDRKDIHVNRHLVKTNMHA